MVTEIYNQNHGRGFSGYDLLDELSETYKLDRRQTHDEIHAALEQIIGIDDADTVITDRRPVRPELLASNDQDLDVDYWLTITDQAADEIREQFIAAHGA